MGGEEPSMALSHFKAESFGEAKCRAKEVTGGGSICVEQIGDDALMSSGGFWTILLACHSLGYPSHLAWIILPEK